MRIFVAIKAAFLALAVFSLVTTPMALRAQSVAVLSGPLIEDAATKARMESAIETLEAARAKIDRRVFDIDARLADLGYDGESIVDFVTGSIAFEQYPGLLRGAEGTLMAGGGNALDQAVLLARMLRDAGLDARIQRGTLSDTDAATLYATLGAQPERRQPSFGLEDLREVVEALIGIAPDALPNADGLRAIVAAPWSAEDDPRYTAARSEADAIIAELGGVLDDIRANQTPDVFIAEITDYFWVEYRESVLGDWTAAHPVMAGFAPAVTASDSFVDAIPEELQHRIAVRVVNERARGSDLERTEILPVWEQPAALLHGRTIDYTNVPANIDALFPAIEAASVEPIQFFLPVFMGQAALAGQIFDAQGSTAPADALASPAAGVFQEVSEQLSGAIGALSDTGSDGAGVPTLVAQWIEIDMIAPGGATKTHRRTVVDLLAGRERVVETLPSQDERDAALLPLLSSFSYVVNTGRIPAAFMLDEALGNAIDVLRYLKDAELDPTAGLRSPAAPPEGRGAMLLQAMAGAFDAGLLESEAQIYRHEPTIVGLLASVEARDGQTMAAATTDILSNARRAMLRGEEGVRLDPESALRVGVWESFLESPPVLEGEGVTVTRAAEELAGRGAGTALSVVAADDAIFGPSPGDRVFAGTVAEKAAQGLFVAVPKAEGQATAGEFGWAIDTATGSVIAIDRNGFGMTTTELVVVMLVAVGLTGIVACYAGTMVGFYDFDTSVGCMVAVSATTAVAAAIGFMAVSGPAATGFLITGAGFVGAAIGLAMTSLISA